MTESDTRAKLVTPKLIENGWLEKYIKREQGYTYYFTDGKKIVGTKPKRAKVDYLLTYKNIDLAIVEAKANTKDPLDGLAQVITYGEKLQVDYVYTTNGDKIYEHSMKNGKGEFIENYPSPEELFSRRFKNINSTELDMITTNYHQDSNTPRFYQKLAIQKSIDTIIKDKKDRLLLTLATGTGKTTIAFQIAYRLFKARWNRSNNNKQPKILFLADRKILIDQALNTFNPIKEEIKHISAEAIKKNGGKVSFAGNIFFAIYQSIIERKNYTDTINAYYKQYPKDFFDLIIIDECHRGSANDNSSWRKILEYFNESVQLGLTATPKRDDNGDTYKYFNERVYEYSLEEGINDGFLTPYKVKRITTNIDNYEFNPNDIIEGDLEANEVALDKFEKEVIIPKRTELIAKTILKTINPYDKTIIFCVNQTHASNMRVAIDKYKKTKDNNYCVRITSDEKKIGRDFLEQFQDNDKTIPAIVTSSKMLTTGVDAKNVRNIVLTAPIKSITEFKQIIGRGTRTYEGKEYFTIIDFVGATTLFYDPRWDGELKDEKDIEKLEVDETILEEETTVQEEQKEEIKLEEIVKKDEEKTKKEKVTIHIKSKKLKVVDELTLYLGNSDKPLKTDEYLEYLIGILGKQYNDENQLREKWANPKTRKILLNKLEDLGIDKSSIDDLRVIFDTPNSDIYDLLTYLCFEKTIITREQRALKVINSDFIEKYQSDIAKEFIEFILNRYIKDGIEELEEESLPRLIDLSKLGSVKELSSNFGGIQNLKNEYLELQKVLYK